MRIAFLTNMVSNNSKPGGYVHVTQVANNLFSLDHTLYTNLLQESDRFVKLPEEDFFRRGIEVEAFYIRIHGHESNDELTRFRKANPEAPCIWEINAPLEELRMRGVHEEDLRRKNNRRKKLAQVVDAAVCVSHEMEEYARDFLGIEKTFVVHNGSDPGIFTPEKREPGLYGQANFTVLWSGSSEFPWQGLGVVQELADRLKDVDSSILVAVTAEGASTDNLLYLGSIPYGEMPRYMASADVGLCIYKKIDFFDKFFFSPLKLYDYMASGLPVIGSNVGQIRLVLEECNNGLLTDTTVDDLVEKILYLKNNRIHAQEMGKSGRRAVIERNNWRNVTLQLERIMSDLITERKNQKTSKFLRWTHKKLGRVCKLLLHAVTLNPNQKRLQHHLHPNH